MGEQVYKKTTTDLQYSWLDNIISGIRGFLSIFCCNSLMTGKKQYAYNIAGNASSSQGKHGYSCDTKKELANGDAPSEPYEDEKPSTQLSSTTSQVMQATSTIVASQNRLG